MTPQKTIPYDTFLEAYAPIRNHLDEDSAFEGLLFETYGGELAFIRSQPEANIWTLVEDEDSVTVISGFHQVNRLGYFLTQIPVAENHRVETPL